MTGRVHAVAFVLVCLLGAVASVALAVRAATSTPPVTVDLGGTTRTGLTTTVAVAVRNTTDQARCVEVRVAARDRTGRDLGVVTAAEELTLPAHAARRLTARVTLTARQYAEQLDTFYPSAAGCRDRERAT